MILQAELTMQGMAPEIVEYSLQPGKLILKGLSGELILLPRDLHQVRFPRKNETLITFGPVGEHRVCIKFQNIRGFLKQQMGELPEYYSLSERILGMGLWPFVLIGSALLAIILLVYFLVLPWMADYATEKFPRDAEIQLGKELHASYISGEKMDTLGSAMLNDFGKTINFQTEYPLHFTLIESETINAFAVPGGEIVVYTGILKIIQSEDELAGLMAHEASHVIYRHSVKSMMRQIAGSALIGLLVGDVGDISSTLASQADQFRNLSFSRELETEADLKGREILVKNNIHPKGMVGLLKSLKKAHPDGSAMPEFLMTHPLPDSSIEALEKINKEEIAREQKHEKRNSLFKQLKQRINSF